MAKIYIFTGAGNNFVVLDGRGQDMAPYRVVDRIQALCRKYHTDGLMILDDATNGLTGPILPDFVMEFYNPDGSGGMMCGNGGRCIVAFADLLGLRPAAPDGTWHFLAPDGMHEAIILSAAGEVHMSSRGHLPRTWRVRLKMIDVNGITPMMDGLFLNTGTRHFVKFVEDVEAVDMEREAKPLRWDPAFAPEGTNVNFVQVAGDGLHVRTFEKGVEGETLACGTGLTACALAAWYQKIPGQAGNEGSDSRNDGNGGKPSYRLQCRRGGWLTVDFEPSGAGFHDVFLTGPAECLSAEVL